MFRNSGTGDVLDGKIGFLPNPFQPFAEGFADLVGTQAKRLGHGVQLDWPETVEDQVKVATDNRFDQRARIHLRANGLLLDSFRRLIR